MPCACSLSICMLFCYCTVCVHVSGASSNTGYSSSDPHAEEGIKEHLENLVPVSKSASRLTGRERRKKETNSEKVKDRRREGTDKSICKCVWRYCVLGFDFLISAAEEEMQYSAVNF